MCKQHGGVFCPFQYIAVGRSNKLDEIVYMLDDEWASTKKFNDIHRYHECISTASRNVKNLLQRKMSRSIITKILQKPCSGVHF